MPSSEIVTRRLGGIGQRRARGFTLIEILVALVVVALALTAVGQTLGQSIDAARGLRQRTIALWVAQNRLASHYVARDWPAADTSDGVSEMAGSDWRWHEQIAATPDPDVRRIEIEVRATRDGQALARLVGFLSQPAAFVSNTTQP